jgi:hypothetical protein
VKGVFVIINLIKVRRSLKTKKQIKKSVCFNFGLQIKNIKYMKKKLSIIFLTLCMGWGITHAQTTYYVKASASGSNNGLSWANAFTDLQSAISVAVSSDQIWVAAGTYKPSVQLDVDGSGGSDAREVTFFIPGGVSMYGGFNGTETLLSQRNWATNITILSGDIGTTGVNTDNAYHVVNTIDVNSNTNLSGFTITFGQADLFGNNNLNAHGGGWLNRTSGSTNSSPAISNIIFDKNYAAAFGGGLENFIQTSGGVCASTVTDCIFSSNHGDWLAGGIYNTTYGGGTANITVVNSLFYNNSTTGNGSSMYNDGRFSGQCNTSLINCTFSGNTDQASAGGTVHNENDGAGQANATITNCIFWNNNMGSISNSTTASTNISYSIINEISVSSLTTAGTGMIYNTDPLFTNAGATNFTLKTGSPAISTGNTTANTTLVDLAGNSRTTNTTIDLGCYEFIPVGAALNFSASNNYVNVGASTNIPVGNAPYTIEAWVNLGTTPASIGIVGWGNFGTNSEVNAIRTDGGTGGIYNYWWYNDLFASPSTGNFNLFDGNWHHVAATFDGTTRAILIDGVIVASDQPSGHNVTTANNLAIGVADINLSEYFTGTMDEVRIWNRGLCQGEIQNNMNAELKAPQTGLVLYYKFNEGIAAGTNTVITTAADSSGNGNNGTLTNFALTGTTSNWVTPGAVTTGSLAPAFAGSVISIITYTNAICAGTSTTFTATGNAGNSYVWSASANSATTNTVVVTPTGTASTVYSVVGTNSVGCITNIATTTLSVNPLPTITVNSGTVCVGNSFTITPSGANTYTYSSGNAIITPIVAATTNYTVSGTNGNGCVNTTTVSVDAQTCSTGIDGSNNTMQVMVYPNPSNGSFSIATSISENTTLVIYNSIGQLVYMQQLSKSVETINTNLDNGMYTIKLQNTQGVSTQHIIIAQ